MRKIRRPKHGAEYYIQRDLINYLRARGWHVERMIGNAYQSGVPDLFCAHPQWGTRWIDVKQPGKNYSFTTAQKRKWPIWERFRVGIWILTAANQEAYDTLFRSPNWRDYWKKSWGQIPTLSDIDAMLDVLDHEV